jgi:cytochrome c
MKTKLALFAAAAALTLSGVASADQALAQKNACMSCHGVDKQIVGPAFKQIAAKYKADKGAEQMLFKRVKDGSKGVWGPIPMPPNPQVSDADLHKILKWILSL